MPPIKNIITLLISLVLVVSCSSNNKFVNAEYATDVITKYPVASIFSNAPTAELKRACHEFNEQSALNHCNINTINVDYYWQSFEKMKLFNKVLLADQTSVYKIAIATTSMDSETAGELSQAAFSGATLLLVPITLGKEVHSEVSIYWKDIKLKQYNYQLPHIAKVSLFNKINEADELFANSLTSHIIADVQNDKLFSPQYLVNFLNSSDYEKEAVIPDKISDFSLVNKSIFNEPLLGLMSTYLSSKYHNDKIDLFIYPIRSVELSDYEKILKQESDNIKKEIEIVTKEQKWSDLVFSEEKVLEVKSKNGVIKGLYFQGSYKRDLDEEAFTSTYLFMLKDKFIKLRATFPESYLTQHVKKILPNLQVPDESLFMAKLRQRSRKNSFQ